MGVLPWVECPTIEVSLDRPAADRLRDVPPDALEKGRRLLGAVMQQVPPQARFVADAVRLRTANRFHKEALALAERVDADWRAIVIANVSYDLVLATLACSTVALPTPAGPVLARNMDWWPEDILAQTSYLIRYVRGGRLAFANAGWPGAIGVVTGLSARGFAIALNAVLSPERICTTGYPVLLHIRRVLEDAADFDAALKMLSEQRLVAPALLTLVGCENNQRVVIERTPKRHALRWAEGGRPLVTTNHYRLLPQPHTHDAGEIDETTCARYEAFSGLVASHTDQQAIEDAALLYMLTDPSVMQEITAQHCVMRPRSRQIRLFAPRRLVAASERGP